MQHAVKGNFHDRVIGKSILCDGGGADQHADYHDDAGEDFVEGCFNVYRQHQQAHHEEGGVVVVCGLKSQPSHPMGLNDASAAQGPAKTAGESQSTLCMLTTSSNGLCGDGNSDAANTTDAIAAEASTTGSGVAVLSFVDVECCPRVVAAVSARSPSSSLTLPIALPPMAAQNRPYSHRPLRHLISASSAQQQQQQCAEQCSSSMAAPPLAAGSSGAIAPPLPPHRPPSCPSSSPLSGVAAAACSPSPVGMAPLAAVLVERADGGNISPPYHRERHSSSCPACSSCSPQRAVTGEERAPPLLLFSGEDSRPALTPSVCWVIPTPPPATVRPANADDVASPNLSYRYHDHNHLLPPRSRPVVAQSASPPSLPSPSQQQSPPSPSRGRVLATMMRCVATDAEESGNDGGADLHSPPPPPPLFAPSSTRGGTPPSQDDEQPSLQLQPQQPSQQQRSFRVPPPLDALELSSTTTTNRRGVVVTSSTVRAHHTTIVDALMGRGGGGAANSVVVVGRVADVEEVEEGDANDGATEVERRLAGGRAPRTRLAAVATAAAGDAPPRPPLSQSQLSAAPAPPASSSRDYPPIPSIYVASTAATGGDGRGRDASPTASAPPPPLPWCRSAGHGGGVHLQHHNRGESLAGEGIAKSPSPFVLTPHPYPSRSYYTTAAVALEMATNGGRPSHSASQSASALSASPSTPFGDSAPATDPLMVAAAAGGGGGGALFYFPTPSTQSGANLAVVFGVGPHQRWADGNEGDSGGSVTRGYRAEAYRCDSPDADDSSSASSTDDSSSSSSSSSSYSSSPSPDREGHGQYTNTSDRTPTARTASKGSRSRDSSSSLSLAEQHTAGAGVGDGGANGGVATAHIMVASLQQRRGEEEEGQCASATANAGGQTINGVFMLSDTTALLVSSLTIPSAGNTINTTGQHNTAAAVAAVSVPASVAGGPSSRPTAAAPATATAAALPVVEGCDSSTPHRLMLANAGAPPADGLRADEGAAAVGRGQRFPFRSEVAGTSSSSSAVTADGTNSDSGDMAPPHSTTAALAAGSVPIYSHISTTSATSPDDPSPLIPTLPAGHPPHSHYDGVAAAMSVDSDRRDDDHATPQPPDLRLDSYATSLSSNADCHHDSINPCPSRDDEPSPTQPLPPANARATAAAAGGGAAYNTPSTSAAREDHFTVLRANGGGRARRNSNTAKARPRPKATSYVTSATPHSTCMCAYPQQQEHHLQLGDEEEEGQHMEACCRGGGDVCCVGGGGGGARRSTSLAVEEICYDSSTAVTPTLGPAATPPPLQPSAGAVVCPPLPAQPQQPQPQQQTAVNLFALAVAQAAALHSTTFTLCTTTEGNTADAAPTATADYARPPPSPYPFAVANSSSNASCWVVPSTATAAASASGSPPPKPLPAFASSSSSSSAAAAMAPSSSVHNQRHHYFDASSSTATNANVVLPFDRTATTTTGTGDRSGDTPDGCDNSRSSLVVVEVAPLLSASAAVAARCPSVPTTNHPNAPNGGASSSSSASSPQYSSLVPVLVGHHSDNHHSHHNHTDPSHTHQLNCCRPAAAAAAAVTVSAAPSASVAASSSSYYYYYDCAAAAVPTAAAAAAAAAADRNNPIANSRDCAEEEEEEEDGSAMQLLRASARSITGVGRGRRDSHLQLLGLGGSASYTTYSSSHTTPSAAVTPSTANQCLLLTDSSVVPTHLKAEAEGDGSSVLRAPPGDHHTQRLRCSSSTTTPFASPAPTPLCLPPTDYSHYDGCAPSSAAEVEVAEKEGLAVVKSNAPEVIWLGVCEETMGPVGGGRVGSPDSASIPPPSFSAAEGHHHYQHHNGQDHPRRVSPARLPRADPTACSAAADTVVMRSDASGAAAGSADYELFINHRPPSLAAPSSSSDDGCPVHHGFRDGEEEGPPSRLLRRPRTDDGGVCDGEECLSDLPCCGAGRYWGALETLPPHSSPDLILNGVAVAAAQMNVPYCYAEDGEAEGCRHHNRQHYAEVAANYCRATHAVEDDNDYGRFDYTHHEFLLGDTGDGGVVNRRSVVVDGGAGEHRDDAIAADLPLPQQGDCALRTGGACALGWCSGTTSGATARVSAEDIERDDDDDDVDDGGGDAIGGSAEEVNSAK